MMMPAMTPLMMVYYAFRNCLRHPRRAALVMLTIGLGAFGLFLYHGLNNGLLAQYRVNTIHAKYGHGQVFRKGFYGQVHQEPWKFWIDDYANVQKNLLAQPQVSQVFPRLSFSALLTNGHTRVNALGTGVDGVEEKKFFDKLNVIKGEATSGDTQKIFLGVGLARALKVKPGDRITVLATTLAGSMNALDLELGGIFQIGARDIDDRFFQIEFATAQQLLDTTAAESIAVALKDDTDWPALSSYANHPELNLEAVPFEVLDKIYYGNSVEWLGKQFGVFQIIILFIVLLGVFTTVSVSILERREEFGFLRSNGETRIYIGGILLLESFFLSVAGCLCGLGLAWLVNATLLSKGLAMPPAPGFTLPFDFKILLVPAQGIQVSLMCLATTLVATILAGYRSLSASISESLQST